MKNDIIALQLEEAKRAIENLKDELAQTHDGLLALTLELEQRVEERTAQLQIRAQEQAVVAMVSQKALTNNPLDELMNEVAGAVLRTLQVEYCLILGRSCHEDSWEIKALACSEELEAKAKIIVVKSNKYLNIFRFHLETLIVEDFQTEKYIKIPELLHDQGMISGISTPINSTERLFGYLDIYASTKRRFSSDDVHFIKSIANVLAGALERKQTEDQLKYYSLHDSLTKLYNRNYFEEEIERLKKGRLNSVGIIMCDIDGLKLINDTLGHNYGDRLLCSTADLLLNTFRSCDMIARIGGDEFIILLPNIDEVAIESACKRFESAIDNYNLRCPELPLSISVGFAIDIHGTKRMSELLKEADDKMYREKLQHGQSARSAIVHTLMGALAERDFITQGHAERLIHMVRDIALAIKLPDHKIGDLQLLAQFHDIGKVGISDKILFKPGPLTLEEVVEMQRHSEIGYRIAKAAPDLVPIADWILKHHEWWNGKGYPLGLKGGEIPLECRILAIADAYDAMTSHRPYREALSIHEVIAELNRCAGIQFDPELVPRFIEVLNAPGKSPVFG